MADKTTEEAGRIVLQRHLEKGENYSPAGLARQAQSILADLGPMQLEEMDKLLLPTLLEFNPDA